MEAESMLRQRRHSSPERIIAQDDDERDITDEQEEAVEYDDEDDGYYNEQYNSSDQSDEDVAAVNALETSTNNGTLAKQKKRRIRRRADSSINDTSGFVYAMALIGLIIFLFFTFVYIRLTAIEAPTEASIHRRKLQAQHGIRTPPQILSLQVNLSQLYTGDTIKLPIQRQHVCKTCMGTGADREAGIERCHTCGGSGVQTFLQEIGGRKQYVRSVCQKCQGKGRIVKKKCGHCRGHGHLPDKRTLDVVIERGMAPGNELMFENEGNQSPGLLPGDVIVQLKMKDDASLPFVRRENDLEMTLSISLLEALVGFQKEIKHLDGRELQLTRSDVIQPNEVWRVNGEGMPLRGKRNTFGDLLVRFTVEYPLELDDTQKQVVTSLLPEST